jgi:hypothetical protein
VRHHTIVCLFVILSLSSRALFGLSQCSLSRFITSHPLLTHSSLPRVITPSRPSLALLTSSTHSSLSPHSLQLNLLTPPHSLQLTHLTLLTLFNSLISLSSLVIRLPPKGTSSLAISSGPGGTTQQNSPRRFSSTTSRLGSPSDTDAASLYVHWVPE